MCLRYLCGDIFDKGAVFHLPSDNLLVGADRTLAATPEVCVVFEERAARGDSDVCPGHH